MIALGKCLVLALVVVTCCSAGEIYKCLVDGKVVFTDQQCVGKGTTLNNLNTSSAGPGGAYNNGVWYKEYSGYQRALQVSKGSGAPLFIYFHADWCGYCRQLENELLDTVAGKAVLAQAIKVKITPEKGSRELALFKQMGGTGYPSTFVQIKAEDAPGRIFLLRSGTSRDVLLDELSKRLGLGS